MFGVRCSMIHLRSLLHFIGPLQVTAPSVCTQIVATYVLFTRQTVIYERPAVVFMRVFECCADRPFCFGGCCRFELRT